MPLFFVTGKTHINQTRAMRQSGIPTIIHIVSNRTWGGGEQYVFDICRKLVQEGIPVGLYSACPPATEEKFSSLGIPIERLHGSSGAFGFVRAIRMAKHLRTVYGHCIIHVHNFKDAFTACYAKALSRRKDIRIIVTRHLVRRGKSSFPYKWMYRKLDRMIFVSRLAHDSFLTGRGISAICEKKAVIIHNSIIPAEPAREDLRREFGIPASACLMMYHGRIVPEKGLEYMIDAMHLVSSSELYAIIIGNGDGTYQKTLENRISESGLEGKVFFTGFRSDAASYIYQCDFGVVPSVAAESFSLTCLEYMSCGKAVITTCNGAQKEFIEHGTNGFLVPPCNAAALAEHMELLYNDRERLKSAGEKARNLFERDFSYGTFFRKLSAIYFTS